MPFNGDWDKLEDLSGPPGENLTCPECNTTYPWEKEVAMDAEGWWPGSAEWWFTKDVEFLCSKTCWLAVQEGN
jgi:hypothetical protein